MAASNFSPSGFSYAQAAKGHSSAAASKTPSSKVTSGTTSPSTGILSEPSSLSTWADDVEASVGTKASDSQQVRQDDPKNSQSKDGPSDSANSEAKAPNGTSAVSSPDLMASSSTPTKDDDLQSPPNGTSSDNTSETKSQTSEPSWISDRKERQSASETRDKAKKGEKKDKDSAVQLPPKPAVLQEAAPPSINPWLKRAEEAKAKANALPKTPVAAPIPDTSTQKENRPIQADLRRHANSTASAASVPVAGTTDELRKQDVPQSKRSADPRNGTSRQTARQGADEARSDSPLSSLNKGNVAERQGSLPNMSRAPTIVKDESAWPTPDVAQDKERKDSIEKEQEEKRDDDATPITKRKKPEWRVMPVVPNVIFETPIPKTRTSQNGERGGRNGNGNRGRGGFRGNASGTNGSDRQASRTNSSPANRDGESADPRARPSTGDREAMPPPPKPVRASSAGSWQERKPGFASERSSSGQSSTPAADKVATNNGKTAPTSSNGLSKSFNETGRSKSPRKLDVAEPEMKDDEFVPKPIPRRKSSSPKTEGADNGNHTGAAPTMTTDTRKEVRSFDGLREHNGGAPRGGRRGGRGRGGNGGRELSNGHVGAHPYGGTYGPEFATSPYGVPTSPYQIPRGHAHFAYAAPTRGPWNSRGNIRSQSIPIDNNYYPPRIGAYPAGVAGPLPPINTYVPTMFDPNAMPMTAMPYPGQMDSQYLIEIVATQLEYYFSMDNLLKDMFLRKHMDGQGFVFMDVVANFNRVKQLTQDKDIIKTACMNSEIIEIQVGEDGKDRLRRGEGWEQFLLPIEQRDESAQNDGPGQLHRPERPHPQINTLPQQYRVPASAGVPHMHARPDRRSYDAAYPVMNGVPGQFNPYGGIPEVMYGEMNGSEEMRGRAAKSPTSETPISPMRPSIAAFEEAGVEGEAEPDAFPDEQAGALTVVVKMSQQQRFPYHALSSRTFSNGSIDSRSIMTEMEKPVDGTSQSKKDTQSAVNGGDNNQLSIPRRPSPNKPRSNERAPGDSSLDVFWVKDQDVPVSNLPSDLTSEPYEQLRLKALTQRDSASTGNCPYDLDVLYQFWCHFLIRNFNNTMYTEFKTFAADDAQNRVNFVGLQNLIKFYSQSLSSHNPIRDRVIKDYVELVKNEPVELQGAAFKQLRSAWRNGALNLKNRKKLADIVDPELKGRLEA